MSDERPGTARPTGSSTPAPRYGEYASAEEQQARIRQPDASVALDAGQSPERVRDRSTARAPAPPPASSQAGTRRTADRVITVGLLTYGLINVIFSAISLADFPAVAGVSMDVVGIPGVFTNVAQGRLLGTLAAVALVLGWVVTAWAAWRRLRAGRTGWWIPLVGAVGTYIVAYSLLMPAILNDPAFSEYLRSQLP